MLNKIIVAHPVPNNIPQYVTQQFSTFFGGDFTEVDYAKVGNYGFLAVHHTPEGTASNRSGLFVINMVATWRDLSKSMSITVFQEATAHLESACCPTRILNATKEFACNSEFRKDSMFYNSSKKQMRDLKIGNIVFLDRGFPNAFGAGRDLAAFRYVNRNQFSSLDEPGLIINFEPHRLYRYGCSIVYPELLDAYTPTEPPDSIVNVAGFFYIKTLTKFVVLGRELTAIEKSAQARDRLFSATQGSACLLLDRPFFM